MVILAPMIVIRLVPAITAVRPAVSIKPAAVMAVADPAALVALARHVIKINAALVAWKILAAKPI